MEVQETKIREWASLHNYKVLAVLVDAGLSGKRADNRPALQDAITQATTHQAAMVVYKLDRLARSTRDAIDIADRLETAGADLVSLTERIDTTTAMGRMFFSLTAALAQLERDLTSERTSSALQQMKSTGRRVGHVPYGSALAADGIHLVDVPDELRIVSRIKRLRKRGLSYHRIAARLTKARVPTRTGRPWHPQQVYVLVQRTA